MLIAFNKPYGVISQFSASGDKPTLADWIAVPDVYPAGRLDFDSEGLLLLTDDGALQNAIANPRQKLEKTYWTQVEGIPDEAALRRLERGVDIAGSVTLPARARRMLPPVTLWQRNPPIRERRNIPTDWIALTISEGRNRQVRRMTAAVGHPTLRLLRASVGAVDLMQLGLAPGAWVEISPSSLGLPKLGSPRKKAGKFDNY